MQITREQHLRYMTKITPLLLVLYLIQYYLYQNYAPTHLRGEVGPFLGVGLALIVLGYHFYDVHHKVIFHKNYLQIRFDLLKINEEILYRKIDYVELRKKSESFGHLIIFTNDGQVFHLRHIDNPETIRDYLEQKLIGQ